MSIYFKVFFVARGARGVGCRQSAAWPKLNLRPSSSHRSRSPSPNNLLTLITPNLYYFLRFDCINRSFFRGQNYVFPYFKNLIFISVLTLTMPILYWHQFSLAAAGVEDKQKFNLGCAAKIRPKTALAATKNRPNSHLQII